MIPFLVKDILFVPVTAVSKPDSLLLLPEEFLPDAEASFLLLTKILLFVAPFLFIKVIFSMFIWVFSVGTDYFLGFLKVD